jgi:hypothetical protein
MLLTHSVAAADFETIYSILQTGKLKSSSITKNVKMFGWEEGSPYVFLNIKDLVKKNYWTSFNINSDFLLTKKFCLNLGWSADCDKESIIEGKKLTKYKLNKLLKEYKEKIVVPVEFVMMSHEILVLKNIDLKKHLKEVYISIKLSEKQLKKMRKLKEKYPNVKFNI